MPDTREKLFDLMMRDPCPYPVHCSAGCDYYKSHHCHAERYADHLIANGVTFAKDNNVPDKWIPVMERLPEDDEVVLIACKIGKMFVGYHKHLYPGCEVWRILTARDSTKNITYTVTHWMPLPEPPKED